MTQLQDKTNVLILSLFYCPALNPLSILYMYADELFYGFSRLPSLMADDDNIDADKREYLSAHNTTEIR